MLKDLIKRKLAALIASRTTTTASLVYDSRTYQVKLNKTGTVVGTDSIRVRGVDMLRKAAVMYSLVDPIKEEEIIVWMRMQSGMDKPELVDEVAKKFHVELDTAEKIFMQAFPDGLEKTEEEALDSLESLALKSECIDVFDILDIVDVLSGDAIDEPLCKNTEDYSMAKIIIASLMRKRNLIV